MWEFLQKSDVLLTAVDILLVAIVIYKLLCIFREATALRILLILPLVIITYLVARLTGLATFTWVLDNFILSMVLIIVVIFQYDIRHALHSFSRGRYAREGVEESHEDESAALLDELADAAHALSERRNGALIVI